MAEEQAKLPEIKKPIIFIGFPVSSQAQQIINDFNDKVKEDFEVVVMNQEMYQTNVAYMGKLRDFEESIAIAKERVTEGNEEYRKAAMQTRDWMAEYLGIKVTAKSVFNIAVMEYDILKCYKERKRFLSHKEVHGLLEALEKFGFMKRTGKSKEWVFTFNVKEELLYWKNQIKFLKESAKIAIQANKQQIERIELKIKELESKQKTSKLKKSAISTTELETNSDGNNESGRANAEQEGEQPNSHIRHIAANL